MCGITAYLGYENGIEYAFNGIKMLLSRGYDGAGIGTIIDGKFVIHKFGTTLDRMAIDMLEETLKQVAPSLEASKNAIMHSRWRSHGTAEVHNVHPHVDYTSRFALVHNGIIENYYEIKQDLIKNYGVTFKSQTDTEVIVNLISVLYDKYNDIETAMNEAFNILEGTWGVALITTLAPEKLFCARHGSPLLIGFGSNYIMVASEQAGFCKYVNNYICLNDSDIVVLEKKNGVIEFTKKNDYKIRDLTLDIGALTPDPYPHWTIKEITEQYDSSLRAMNMGSRILNDFEVKLGGLQSRLDELKNIDNLILLGCGTSFNAGNHSHHIMKQISGFNSVQIFDGAEFTIYDVPKIGKTALIFISQSGETKDLHRCVQIGKDNNLIMIGVINSVDSLIAREMTCGVYLNCGREVAVASTKAFTSQVIVLYLIAIWFAQIRGINENKRQKIISDLRRLPLDIKSTIETTKEQVKSFAKYLLDKSSMYILGKGLAESIAKEGALKIKEIGYIHAEGYSSAALKHGTYSIINPGTPIINLLVNDEHFARNKGIGEELKARYAYTLALTDTKINNNIFEGIIMINKNETFRYLLFNLPLQLLAYELALLKGHNPDYPQNLSKSVVVD